MSYKGFLIDQLASPLQKEHFEEQDWIIADDVDTFITHFPVQPGYDFIPVFDTNLIYPGDQVMFQDVNDKYYIIEVQHVNYKEKVIELRQKLTTLPKIGSDVKKVFGEDTKLVNEKLTDTYHKDVKRGNSHLWDDKEYMNMVGRTRWTTK